MMMKKKLIVYMIITIIMREGSFALKEERIAGVMKKKHMDDGKEDEQLPLPGAGFRE